VIEEEVGLISEAEDLLLSTEVVDLLLDVMVQVEMIISTKAVNLTVMVVLDLLTLVEDSLKTKILSKKVHLTNHLLNKDIEACSQEL
jgi:hypothetical protein